MLIIEKLLEKKIKGDLKIKRTEKRIIFFFSECDHFLTIERLTSDSFIFLVDYNLVDELEYYLGLGKQKISESVLSWFITKYDVEKFGDLKEKILSFRDHIG